MYFASVAELWHMSGHGIYVWLAYSISWFLLLVLTIYPLHKQRQMLQAISLRARNDQGGSNGNAPQT